MGTPPQRIACLQQYDLPRLKIASLKEGNEWRTDGEDADWEFLSSKSVSTYPFFADRNARDGDPIADRLYCSLFKNRAIVALADGCSWGLRPQQAAMKATAAFSDYMRD